MRACFLSGEQILKHTCSLTPYLATPDFAILTRFPDVSISFLRLLYCRFSTERAEESSLFDDVATRIPFRFLFFCLASAGLASMAAASICCTMPSPQTSAVEFMPTGSEVVPAIVGRRAGPWRLSFHTGEERGGRTQW
jgi:hypothetical protein